ncbi:MAG TPA: hypothetical protein VKQ36_05635, partial [Ktedonobacterales bacterium]|nr:hypothetical protein [Ktedonobacterales bacterium]
IWRFEDIDTPFFEFLVPILASELARLGISLPIPGLEVMTQRRDAKLARLPFHLLTEGHSPLIHALEALGPSLGDPQFDSLRDARAPNGSYGCSPAATAAVLIYHTPWDAQAAQWLRRLVNRSPGASEGLRGAMPTSHPADTFEAAWALHFLLHSGVALDVATNSSVQKLLRLLAASLTPAGVSFSRNHALPPDADDTAVTIALLNRLGVQTNLAPLWTFLRGDHLITYISERTASVSANAHALEALLGVDAIGVDRALTRRRTHLVEFLLAQRDPGGFWRDKWHISPLYATLESILALTKVPEQAVWRQLEPTLDWLLGAQDNAGVWRQAPATTILAADMAAIEETAYGVLALRTLARTLAAIVPQRMLRMATQQLRRGQGFLAGYAAPTTLNLLRLPAMYVDKGLYIPYRVVRAAILAALSGG